MPKGKIVSLTDIYTTLFSQERLPLEWKVEQLVDTLVQVYPDRYEGTLHLSLIRRLFSELPSSDQIIPDKCDLKDVDCRSVDTATPKKASMSNSSLCKHLVDNSKFITTLVCYLSSEEQLVSFSASKALVAVLVTGEPTICLSKELLDGCLSNVLTVVDIHSLTDHKSIYCLQVFTDLLKNLRKTTFKQGTSATLTASLTSLQAHWTRILHEYNKLSTFFEAPADLPTTNPCSLPSKKGCGLSLGEFLALNVEILRHFISSEKAVSSRGDSINISPIEYALRDLHVTILRSVCTLSTLVNQSAVNSLYILKRMFDVLLKLNSFRRPLGAFHLLSFHIVTPPPSAQPTSPQLTHPHNTSSHLNDPPSSSNHHLTLLQDSPITIPSGHQLQDASNLDLILCNALLKLLQSSALTSAFIFWVKKFAKIADISSDADAHTADSTSSTLLIENGLKNTITRKAVLLILEYVSTYFTKQVTEQGFIHVNNLLETVLNWAVKIVPPSLAHTLDGLLEDEIDTPSTDFLRLLFFSLLTEQDDCLVKALTACAEVHKALGNCDTICSDFPLLHHCLGIFNIHAFFVKFLSSIRFDTTMLLDFVMSPETDFSKFLKSYLEIVCREKKESHIFNYNLESACAEMDIVDEYMSMEMTESGEEDNCPSQEHAELTSFEHMSGEYSADCQEQLQIANSSSLHQIPSLKSCRSDQTTVSEIDNVSSSRKRECIGTNEPAPKRQKTGQAVTEVNQLSLQQSENVAEHTMPLFTIPISSDLVDASETVKLPSSDPTQDHPAYELIPSPLSDSDTGPPPVQTLMRVLSCLIELGKLLLRLCNKELLSMRVNDIKSIVCQTDEVSQLYSELEL